MRIVFLRSSMGFPDSRVEKEAGSLIRAGFQVFLTAWDRDARYRIRETAISLPEGDMPAVRMGIPARSGGGFKSLFFPLLHFNSRSFAWLVRNRGRYDCLHACDLDTVIPALAVKLLYKKSLVYDIFDYYADSHPMPGCLRRVVRWIEKQVVNRADAVIICSEKRMEQIAGTKPRRIAVIHNTPPLKRLSQEKITFKTQAIRIAYAGTLSRDRFLEETARCVTGRTGCEFHIGGMGALEEFFRNLSAAQERIVFYGRMPYDEVLRLENSCDIMTAIYDPAVPNNRYAAPNKFYEALMLGKPLIMIKDTGMDGYLTRHDIGEVVDLSAGSFEDGLAGAIRRLIERKPEWPEMARRMKALYEQSFSWEEMEGRLLRLYKSL